MKAAASLQARGPRHLSLPFTAESVGVARHALENWLDGEAGDGFAEDCRLVVSELVGNAVRHAQPKHDGTVDVDWTCEDSRVSIAVSDGGSESAPRRLDAALTDLAGRGLAIVEALAARWWVESTHSGTTVHAELCLA